MADLHIRWSHRWITPKAKSGVSKIDALGVIATDAVSKGESVGVLGGVIVPTKDIPDYWKEMGQVGIQIDELFFIVPTNRKELEETGVFNHSCDPNCGFANSVRLVAIKNIKPGEELVFDYAFCETIRQPFACNCGSKNCRKIIKPTDWQIPVLQKKYRDYFSPYLRFRFFSKS